MSLRSAGSHNGMSSELTLGEHKAGGYWVHILVLAPAQSNLKKRKKEKERKNEREKKQTTLYSQSKSWCDQSFMVDPLSYFLFQPVFHDWCNICYPVCGMMYIKEPLLVIGNSRPYGSSRFPLSLSEWSFTNLLC